VHAADKGAGRGRDDVAGGLHPAGDHGRCLHPEDGFSQFGMAVFFKVAVTNSNFSLFTISSWECILVCLK
jgi:hypothetical protein